MIAKVAEKKQEAPVELKLDLGCGMNCRDGFVGVDRRAFNDKVKGITDLSKLWWCFKDWPTDDMPPFLELDSGGQYRFRDSSVTEVHCSHFLEHLNHNAADPARARFMNELYRVLVPGGKATIITPHWASNRAYGDFTHADKPVSEMFYYYLNSQWRKANAPDNDIEWNPDGYACDFDCTWGYGMHEQIIARNSEYQNFAMTWYKEACQDLHCTAVSRKKSE